MKLAKFLLQSTIWSDEVGDNIEVGKDGSRR